MRLHCSVIPTGVHNPRMAANPASDYVSVLNTGLPALPPRMRPGWPVPVAIWNGDRHGAVMVIEDCDHDPYCPRDEHYVAMTYVYRRQGPDDWDLPSGSGGTDWPGGTSTKSSLGAREVLLEGGQSGSSTGWMCSKVDGFVGSAARWVELEEGPNTTRRPIADSGAVVVVLDGDGPATVRIRDDDENVIDTYRF
jgi:hypothetical protein